MKRIGVLVAALAIVAAACGSSSESVTVSTAAITDRTTTTEAQGPSAEVGAGGTPDAGLVAQLGLVECPVGAHEGAGPTEITLWHPFPGAIDQTLGQIAADFNASQDDIVVQVETQEGYVGTFAAYNEAIGSSSLPQIAILEDNTFRSVIDTGTVLPAQSCLEADGYDMSNFEEIVRSYYSLEGALYPASFLVSTPVLFYNRTHLADAGLDPENPPKTMAELRDAARAINEAGVSQVPFAFNMQGWFPDNWLNGAGVQIVNANNGRSGYATEAKFNQPEAVEIFRLLDQLHEDGLMLAVPDVPEQAEHYLPFFQSEASFLVETSTASTAVEDVTTNVFPADVGVAPYPGIDEPGKTLVSGGAWYMTNTGTPAQQAASWAFMKYVNEVEQQKTLHLEASYLPVLDAVVADPDVQRFWQEDKAGQWLAIAHGQIAGIDPELPGPAIGPFTEQRRIMNEAMEAMLIGDATPEEALDEAERQLNEALIAYSDKVLNPGEG